MVGPVFFKPAALLIREVKSGGFVVMACDRNWVPNDILFAGDLDGCLAFIRRAMAIEDEGGE